MATPHQPTLFARFASTVADLADPFYAEERQRDVWNEASAIGFQLMLWGSYALAAAMTWIAGRDAVAYAGSLVLLATAASLAAATHCRNAGINLREHISSSRARLTVWLVVAILLTGGAIRAVVDDTGSASSTWYSSFAMGLMKGLLLGTGAATVVVMALALLRNPTRNGNE